MVFFILIKMLIEHSGGDPDQTPRSVASGLGLHCLPMPNKKDARLLWNKLETIELFLHTQVPYIFISHIQPLACITNIPPLHFENQDVHTNSN